MTEGLFKPYVDSLLKMKQEVSGCPDNCTIEGEKQKFIHDYKEHECIRLDYNKIQDNPGLRHILKIF